MAELNLIKREETQQPGRITQFNRADRTITANGMTVHLPEGLRVKTNDLDQPVGNLEFAADPQLALTDLVDPTLEAQRAVIGGTAIAGGEILFTTTEAGPCIRYLRHPS